MASELIDEIKVFIDYGVCEEEKDIGLRTVQKFSDNTIALKVLRDFYARLPGLKDRAVKGIKKVASRQGAYLLLVKTTSDEFIYFYDGNKCFYIGEKEEGIAENELLTFFGYSSNEAFIKGFEKKQEDAELESGSKNFCPACSVEEGELHHLGCPVEICPWCDSQLNYCNCRFEQLGVEEIESDADIDRLEILLNDRGRIPFSADHAPSYPSGMEENE